MGSKYDDGATRLTYTCTEPSEQHEFDVKLTEGTVAPVVIWASGHDSININLRKRITDFEVNNGHPVLTCNLYPDFSEFELVIANDG